jgi:dephospho-CoA kinase
LKVQKTVGVTGGIGAGKSIICRIFHAMGYPVFYSDEVAKNIINSEPDVIKSITELFGSKAYEGGAYNRTFIAQQVFEDQNLLESLNQIVHPAVRQAFAQWKSEQDAPILFNEAAILFETGMHKNYDFMLLVTAPIEIRIQRVMERDQVSAEAVQKRMGKQWSDAKKMPLADFCIVNDDQTMLLPQVLDIIPKILE